VNTTTPRYRSVAFRVTVIDQQRVPVDPGVDISRVRDSVVSRLDNDHAPEGLVRCKRVAAGREGRPAPPVVDPFSWRVTISELSSATTDVPSGAVRSRSDAAHRRRRCARVGRRCGGDSCHEEEKSPSPRRGFGDP